MRAWHRRLIALAIALMAVWVLLSATGGLQVPTEGERKETARSEEPKSHQLRQRIELEEATLQAARESVAELDGSVIPECTELPINSSFSAVFSASLCYKPRSCEGALIIKSHQCLQGAPSEISHDESTIHILNRFGPDLFRIRLTGPEIVAGLASFKGECTYRFPIEMRKAGTYNLAAERLYKRFDAVNEAFSDWPNLLKESVFNVNFQPNNYHFQQRTLESDINIVCEVDRHRSPVEACTGREADLSGRWVRASTNDFVFTRVRVRKIQRNPIVFQWALQKEPLSVWKPNTCSISRSPTVIDRFLQMYAGKRILIAGDSQLRALYFGLVNVLQKKGIECVRNISTLESEPSFCIGNVKGNHKKRFGDVQVDFYDDLFLNQFSTSRKFDGADVLILGFAQHPASKEHWSVRRYSASLEPKAAKINLLQKEGKRVVWYLAPQYPHTRNGYPVVVKDWRTDARLSIFNTIASNRLRQDRVPLLDGYSISTGMSHTSPDQAHFSNFVSFEIVHLLLTMMNSF